MTANNLKVGVSKLKKVNVEDLWLGEDFEFEKQRYCLIHIGGETREVTAVKMSYNDSRSIGNSLVSFNYGTKIIFIPRKAG